MFSLGTALFGLARVYCIAISRGKSSNNIKSVPYYLLAVSDRYLADSEEFDNDDIILRKAITRPGVKSQESINRAKRNAEELAKKERIIRETEDRVRRETEQRLIFNVYFAVCEFLILKT